MSENIKEALEYAVDLSEQKDWVVESNEGKEFYDGNRHHLVELDPLKYPTTLKLNSLTGLVSYILHDLDIEDFENKKFILNVESPTTVTFSSELDADRKRSVYAAAIAITPNINFGHFYDLENFNIKLVSSFVKTDNRDLLLNVASKVKVDSGTEMSDDGISQIATVKNGVASLEKAKMPNPIELKPYRTFLEVEQPASDFIFRLNDNPGAALFEADGSMWQLAAKANVKEFLKEQLSKLDNVIILA